MADSWGEEKFTLSRYIITAFLFRFHLGPLRAPSPLRPFTAARCAPVIHHVLRVCLQWPARSRAWNEGAPSQGRPSNGDVVK